MRQVLREDTLYPYLMKNAVSRLTQARCTATQSGAADENLIFWAARCGASFPGLGPMDFLPWSVSCALNAEISLA